MGSVWGRFGVDFGTTFANGPGCFAAQFIKHFKDRPGSLYLSPIDDDDYGWADYVYTLFPKEGAETYMAVYDVLLDLVIFVGKPEEALKKYEKIEWQE